MTGSINIFSDLTREFISGDSDTVVDVITFAEASWGLNLKLLPSQKMILKCFYSMELDTQNKYIPVPNIVNDKILYTFTESEFLHFLHEEGRCNTNTVEGKNFQELVLCVGRRGAKSVTAAIVAAYEKYKLVKRGDPAKYYGHQAGASICVLNVAPTDEQASVVFSNIQEFVRRCPYLRDRVLHSTLTYFDLCTDADMAVKGRKPTASLTTISGGCSANSLRGQNSIVVIMDEMAFFITNEGRFSGSQVYKALTPSIGSFGNDGKILCLSSPNAKYGEFYDRYIYAQTDSDFVLSFKMYSAMANNSVSSAILHAARRKSRPAFMCEYGGEFSDSVKAWVEDEDEFRRCVVKSPQRTKGEPDCRYYVGLDLGFKNDGAAIAIAHKDRKTEKIHVDFADVWYSGSSDVWEQEKSIYHGCRKYSHKELLMMSDIVDELEALAKWFPLVKGLFDQSNGYALAELLRARGFTQIEMENFSDKTNHEVYELFKRLYSEELLVLYEHPVYVPEMFTLEGESLNKNYICVRAPRRVGCHDDISDAIVRAVASCYRDNAGQTRRLSTGTTKMGGGVHGVSAARSLPMRLRRAEITGRTTGLMRRYR
jgi:phage terminase large subunit-like protein